MQDWDDLYQILQVDPSANEQAIDAAYWRLAVRYQEENPEDSSLMDEVTRAYVILRDPQQRADYDRAQKARRRATTGLLRWRLPSLRWSALHSLRRLVVAAPGAISGLLKRVRPTWPRRRLAFFGGFAALLTAGLVVGLIYPPSFGGGGKGLVGDSLVGPGESVVAAVAPTPTPDPTPGPNPTPTPLPTKTLVLDPNLGLILDILNQMDGTLQLLAGRLSTETQTSSGTASVASVLSTSPLAQEPEPEPSAEPTPTPTATPVATPAPLPTPTPVPTATSTIAPTPTPTPTLTPTPTPTPVDLSQLNWIERSSYVNGELPEISSWLLPLVESGEEGDSVAGQTVLIPTAEQWCHTLLPSERLKLLDYVVWLGYHYEDWVWQVGRTIGDDWLSRCPPASSY